MAQRNPFSQVYSSQMGEAFGDNWGVAGDPMGDWLAGLESDAQAAYRQRLKQHPGMKRDAFFRKSAFSPDRLQEYYDQYGGGTPTGPWDKRPGRGESPGSGPGSGVTPPTGWQPGPDDVLPPGGVWNPRPPDGGSGTGPGTGQPDPNDDWQNADRPSAFRKHLGGIGFNPDGPTAFDDWLYNTQFDEANVGYETWRKDPANFNKQFTEFLGGGQWNDPRAIRERFFSKDPSRRFEGSERYTGPGRTIQY